MAERGTRILRGIGGDILNPLEGGDAYDEMLKALHDVVEVYDSYGDWNDRTMFVSENYDHLSGVVAGADDESYADLMELRWPRADYKAEGGKFDLIHLFGSFPLYELHLNARRGVVNIFDHEHSIKRRRVGRRALATMSHNLVDQLDNYLDNRDLSNGYVIEPSMRTVIVSEEDGSVTGDSVRRALEPHGDYLDSLAQNFTVEAQVERAEQARRVAERAANPKPSFRA